MKRFVCLVAPLAVLPWTAPVLQAQGITSPYEFVDGRHSAHAYATYVFTDRGVLDLGPESGYAAGIGYGIRVSGPFNFDTRIAFLPTRRTIFDLAAEQPDTAAVRDDPRAGLEAIGTASLSLLLADASLRFDITGPRTWYRLQPYALIGAGAVFRLAEDRSEEEGLPTDVDLRVRFRNGVTGHVGAGVEWHATDRLTVRLDARDVLWRLHVPEGFITGGRVIDDREWVQTAHLSAGLALRF